MKHRSEGATALLGMPGFVVGAQMELDGELWLNVETTADVVGCRSCGTRAVGHGRRRVKVRDLPIAGRDVVVVWAKRIWRCPDADCEVRTWSEHHPAIAARASLTERTRAEICRRVGQDDDSVAKVARDFGVGWSTAMAAVRDHGQPLVAALIATRFVGERAVSFGQRRRPWRSRWEGRRSRSRPCPRRQRRGVGRLR